MKNICCFWGLISAFTVLAGCTDPGPKHPTFELGKPFVLAQKSTMQTADKALTIHFDNVKNDSRCPEGVQCIWAGRADCDFELTNNGTTENITLSSGDFAQGGSGQVNFKGYTIVLNAIAPAKQSGTDIKQDDYRATLTVTK